MMKFSQIKQLAIVSLSLLMVSAAEASERKTLSLIAENEPAISIAAGTSQIIQYKVSNQGNHFEKLNLKPYPGIHQETAAKDLCQSPLFLKPGESCTLRLKVESGVKLLKQQRFPMLCDLGVNWYDKKSLNVTNCMKAKRREALHVQEVAVNTATFTVEMKGAAIQKEKQGSDNNRRCFASNCPLILFATGATGSFIITNTSSQTIRNIKATFPWPDVTQNASSCAALAPGASCAIVVTPGAQSHPLTSVPIQGDGTPVVHGSMQVLGIGDSYQNGFIVSITAGTNTGLLVATSDAPGPLVWSPLFDPTLAISESDGESNTAIIVGFYGVSNSYAAGFCYKNTSFTAACAGPGNHCWFLPAANQATTIGNAMASSGKTFGIGGGTYWTSTEFDGVRAYAGSISTPPFAATFKDNPELVRCTRSFG